MLAFDAVTRVFRDGPVLRRALDGVTLRVARGEVVALTGENGSGKTTLLRIGATLDAPTSGSLEVAGKPTRSDPTRARRHLAYLGQDDGLYDALTVRENLAFVARAYGHEARIEDAARTAGIAPHLDERAGHLSRGERQRVAFARALVGGDVMLLDEPTTALDAEGRDRLGDALQALRGERTVLLATHDERLAAECDRIVRLHQGRLVEVEP